MIKGRSGGFSRTVSVVTLGLLLIYLASSLRLDSIHQLFHVEDITELHSAEKEQDPCHKNIYHQQKESGCAHKSHITQNNKCPLCEHSTSAKVILSAEGDFEACLPSRVFEYSFSEAIPDEMNCRTSGRSPPQG